MTNNPGFNGQPHPTKHAYKFIHRKNRKKIILSIQVKNRKILTNFFPLFTSLLNLLMISMMTNQRNIQGKLETLRNHLRKKFGTKKHQLIRKCFDIAKYVRENLDIFHLVGLAFISDDGLMILNTKTLAFFLQDTTPSNIRKVLLNSNFSIKKSNRHSQEAIYQNRPELRHYLSDIRFSTVVYLIPNVFHPYSSQEDIDNIRYSNHQTVNRERSQIETSTWTPANTISPVEEQPSDFFFNSDHLWSEEDYFEDYSPFSDIGPFSVC